MSLASIRSALANLASSACPQVVTLSGKWGCGKTYLWNQCIKEAAKKDASKDVYYSYVSLFGVNSLEAVRRNIFERRLSIYDSAIEINKQEAVSVHSSIYQLNSSHSLSTPSKPRIALLKAKRLIRKLNATEPNVPYVKSISGLALELRDSFVKDQLICFDDIERRGKDLRLIDLFGLANSLSLSNSCRILFILNEDALDSDEKATLQTHGDKTFSAQFAIRLNPKEAVELAIKGDSDQSHFIKKRCAELNISNFRVLFRIKAVADSIYKSLASIDREIQDTIVSHAIVITWITFCSEDAPSYAFYSGLEATLLSLSSKKIELVARETAWTTSLQLFGVKYIEELDRPLLVVVKSGFFNAESIEPFVKSRTEELLRNRKKSKLMEAWELFHNSFEHNTNTVVAAFYDACKEGVKDLDLHQFQQATALLKHLGFTDKAVELEDLFASARSGDFMDFKASEYELPQHNTNLLEKLDSLSRENSQQIDLSSLLITIGQTNGWNPEQVKSLAQLTKDDLVKIFTKLSGEDLRTAIRACTFFTEPLETSKEPLAALSNQALVVIGKTSPLNAHRVLKYGIDLK
jgi:hypothetical protein